MTAPTVAPQTTIPIADARRAGGYRSAADVARQLVGGCCRSRSGPSRRGAAAATDDTTAIVATTAPTTPIA